jgi:uncharacterized membrane protein YphA (DoxX/SURF4 family)
MNRRRMLALILRIVLGCVWLYAAYAKFRESWLVFAMSIDAYRMLPQWAVLAVARSLPWIELAIGILLVAGLALRYVSIAGAAILSVFFCVMAVARSRGLGIDCGCFGPGDTLSGWTLLRDGTLLAAAITLAGLSWRQDAGHASQLS